MLRAKPSRDGKFIDVGLTCAGKWYLLVWCAVFIAREWLTRKE
jgi:hypothetical protein